MDKLCRRKRATGASFLGDFSSFRRKIHRIPTGFPQAVGTPGESFRRLFHNLLRLVGFSCRTWAFDPSRRACPIFPQTFPQPVENPSRWKSTNRSRACRPKNFLFGQGTTFRRQNRRHFPQSLCHPRQNQHKTVLFLSFQAFPHHFSTGCGKVLWKTESLRKNNPYV